jgi:hypothetical protein
MAEKLPLAHGELQEAYKPATAEAASFVPSSIHTTFK